MKPKVEVKRDTVNPKLGEIQAKFKTELEQTFRQATEAILVTAKDLARRRLKRPGTYLEKFFYEFRIEGNNLIFAFGNRHHAARIIEEGSKPHRIPREGFKTLCFFKEGEWKFRLKVEHPGTKPTHIVRDAVLQNKPLLDQAAKSLGARL